MRPGTAANLGVACLEPSFNIRTANRMHSRLGCKSYFRGVLFHKNRSYTQNARSSAQQHQAWLVPLDHLDQPGLDKVDFRRRPAGDRRIACSSAKRCAL